MSQNRHRLARVTLLAIVALGTGATIATASKSALKQRFFLSPSGNISCELDYTVGNGPTDAYCQADKPGVSVTMSPAGKLRICNGTRCLGNPPDNATTLGYGKSVTLGPFKCTSLTSAMDCRVTATARGFAISRSGVSSLH